MAIYVKEEKGIRAKVWRTEDKGKYILVSFSTTDKTKDVQGKDKYVYSNWVGRMVGRAFTNYVEAPIQKGDNIMIKSMKIEKPSYKNAEGAYIETVTVVIFDWSYSEPTTHVEDDDLPE